MLHQQARRSRVRPACAHPSRQRQRAASSHNSANWSTGRNRRRRALCRRGVRLARARPTPHRAAPATRRRSRRPGLRVHAGCPPRWRRQQDDGWPPVYAGRGRPAGSGHFARWPPSGRPWCPARRITRGRKLRSTGTKATARVSNVPNSLVELKKQLEVRTRELAEARGHLSEALEQQTAASEVLRVISSSPGELESVFQGVLENATRICGATFGAIFYYEGGAFRPAAELNVPTAYSEFMRQRGPFQPAAGSTFEHVIRTKQPVRLADAAAEEQFFSNNAAKLGGAPSFLAVPMLKEGELIGAIAIYRQEVRPFTDKQVELVTNFAAQAVIAIDNTRLLNELHQRTDDLSEALEQQTATSEVLRVISSSPGELQPVFQAMLSNATRICEANFGVLFRFKGEAVEAAAMVGVPPAFAEFWQRGPQRPGPRTALGRIVETKQTIHIVDVTTEPAYVEGEPVFVAAVNLVRFRTILGVPLLKEDELIGAFAIYRQEVRPFNDKQIELVKSFANQAVIAIENVRLLNELRESLQQQTATADVLKVISSSPCELQPVLQAMLE